MQDTSETPGGGTPNPATGAPDPATGAASASGNATPPPPPPPAAAPQAHSGATKPLVARVRDILMQPKSEWGVIDAEPSSVNSILMGYVLILAAIPSLAILIGQQVFGYSLLGITYRPSMGSSITTALLTYIMSVGTVYVVAMIIDALAPNFGGTKNMTNAFKVAAYAATAGWVAGILNIIPMLGWLALIGSLYGLYLLYLGLPKLMKVGEDKAVGYVVVVVVVEIVIALVIGMVVATIVASMFPLGGLLGGGGRIGY